MFFFLKDSSGLQVPLELITNSSCKTPHGGTPGGVSRLTSSVLSVLHLVDAFPYFRSHQDNVLVWIPRILYKHGERCARIHSSRSKMATCQNEKWKHRVKFY